MKKIVTNEELKEAVLDYGELAARSKLFSERSGAYKAICHVIDVLYMRPAEDELVARLAVAEQEIETLRALLTAEIRATKALEETLSLADKVYEMAANALGAQRFSLEQYRKARAAHWATVGVVEKP